MGALKDKVLKELHESNYTDLYDQINQIDNDVDVANYINSSKKYFTQTMSDKDLEGMPTFSQALFGELKTGKVDYDKEFGKDWYNRYEEIPYQEIKFVADKQGVSPNELINKLGDEATKLRRQDIALGKDGDKLDRAAGFITNMVFPRGTEAVARGESPSREDYIGDVGQNVLYATPWGGIARVLGATSKVAGPAIRGVASNVTAPLASEVYDTAVYDKENPRGNFSVADVAGGTLTNVVTPELLRFGASRAGRYISPLSKFNEFGGGQTAKEIAEEQLGKYRYVPIRMADDPTVSVAQRSLAKEMKQLSESDPALYRVLTGNPTKGGIPKGSRWASIKDIVGTPGKSIDEKANNYLKSRGFNGPSYISPDGRIFTADTPDELIAILQQHNVQVPTDLMVHSVNPKHPYGPVSKTIMNYYDESAAARAAEGAKTATQIAKEEAVKNYITNNAGDKFAEEGKIYTRIPFGIGLAVQNYVDEQEKEEQDKLLQEAILEELKEKYGTPDEPKSYRLLKGER